MKFHDHYENNYAKDKMEKIKYYTMKNQAGNFTITKNVYANFFLP